MRTLTILALGFGSLAAVLVLARFLGGRARAVATALFIPVWGLACAANAAMGVRAGYSVALELAVFALTFGLPGGLAWRIRRNVSREQARS